jgi:hypothetical protein
MGRPPLLRGLASHHGTKGLHAGRGMSSNVDDRQGSTSSEERRTSGAGEGAPKKVGRRLRRRDLAGSAQAAATGHPSAPDALALPHIAPVGSACREAVWFRCRQTARSGLSTAAALQNLAGNSLLYVSLPDNDARPVVVREVLIYPGSPGWQRRLQPATMVP